MTNFIGHQIGTGMINLLNPQPDQIDTQAVNVNLMNMRRFNGNPNALTIMQHSELVALLIEMDRAEGFPTDIYGTQLWNDSREWARHHDDHEAIIGDIVGPVKDLISSRCNIIEITEVKIDKVLCAIRGSEYPSEIVRSMVHRYDKAAETIEWRLALDMPQQDWNSPCPLDLYNQGPSLLHQVRTMYPHG